MTVTCNFPRSVSFQHDEAGEGPSPAALVHFLASFNSFHSVHIGNSQRMFNKLWQRAVNTKGFGLMTFRAIHWEAVARGRAGRPLSRRLVDRSPHKVALGKILNPTAPTVCEKG